MKAAAQVARSVADARAKLRSRRRALEKKISAAAEEAQAGRGRRGPLVVQMREAAARVGDPEAPAVVECRRAEAANERAIESAEARIAAASAAVRELERDERAVCREHLKELAQHAFHLTQLAMPAVRSELEDGDIGSARNRWVDAARAWEPVTFAEPSFGATPHVDMFEGSPTSVLANLEPPIPSGLVIDREGNLRRRMYADEILAPASR